MQTYTYIEAVQKLPTNFSAAEVEPILKRINPDLAGKIRSIFVVLSDDQFRKSLRKTRTRSNPQQAPPTQGAEAEEESETEDDEEAQDDPEANQAQPPAPPNPPVPPVVASGSKPVSSSRKQKRGASSSLASLAKK